MTTTSRRARHSRRAAAPALLLLLALTGCSGAGGSDSMSSADSAASGSRAAPEAASAEAASGADARGVADVGSPVAAVISTGTVALRGRDVAALLFDVQQVLDAHGGEITERDSDTDDDGEVARARLVVRVPADEFGETMAALEQTGTLVSSTSESEDVTTQVIDNDVRIGVQRASIDRIRALLADATDLKQVVAIEAQLASREADLGSLEQTQAYLTDRSDRSTITVAAERTRAVVTEGPTDDAGFVSGLRAGWDALSGATTAAATVVGALLPWAVLAAVLGGPAALVVRRARRGHRRPVDAV